MTRPPKVTAEGERSQLVEQGRQTFCDIAIHLAMKSMAESGAENEMIVDRLIMAALYRAADDTTPEALGRAFRLISEEIERGVFHSLPKTDGRQH